ncbi:hypothetical protein EC973_009082 [Apophysomyces ossiformis]|uniref:Nuclear pore complex protein n=1 Tax=Apophysomyces ossiformis TaxID=679940 RepID=A0A8H7BPN5_9FUNG|nr:hypothetical protein EC973_009082 [Apophysomyces ossiformis]
MNAKLARSESTITLKRDRCDLDRDFVDTIERAQNLPQLAQHLANVIRKRMNQAKDEGDTVCFDYFYDELRTWELVDTLYGRKERFDVPYFAIVRTWLSTVAHASHMNTDDEKEDTEDEIEAEIHAMFGVNGSTISSNSAEVDQSIKRRLLRPEDKIAFEKLNRSLYMHLRRGEPNKAIALSESCDDPWRTALLKTYVEMNKNINEGKKWTWDKVQRDIWRRSCKALARQHDAQRYEKAFYGVLSGDMENVLPVCKTYEDVLWAYCNAKVDDSFEQYQSPSAQEAISGNSTNLLATKAMKLALNKDSLLPRGHPRRFFHIVQSKLLSKDIPSLVNQLYQACTRNEWQGEFGVSSAYTFVTEALRFASSLILYLSIHGNLQQDEKFNEILAVYMMHITSNLSFKSLIPLSTEEFDGDKDERSLLIELGAQYKLDTAEILRTTYKNTMGAFLSSFPSLHSIESRANVDEIFELEGEITNDVLPCIRALEWLSMSDALADDLIKAANETIRRFLGTRQIYLVKAILDTVPDDIINISVLQTQGDLHIPHFLDEFAKHRLLVECLEEYRKWDCLRYNEPKDTGSLDALKLIHQWKREFETLSESLSMRLRTLLESQWLRVTKAPSDQVLRKIYIPELTIRLYTVLSESDPESCDELVTFIADAKHGFVEELLATGKTLKLFNQMVRARAANKVGLTQ